MNKKSRRLACFENSPLKSNKNSAISIKKSTKWRCIKKQGSPDCRPMISTRVKWGSTKSSWKSKRRKKSKDLNSLKNIRKRKSKSKTKRKSKKRKAEKRLWNKEKKSYWGKSKKRKNRGSRKRAKENKGINSTKSSPKVWLNILPFSKNYSKNTIVATPSNKTKGETKLWASVIRWCSKIWRL